MAGSTWVGAAFFPSSWPELLRICFHDSVVCAGLAVWALLTRQRSLDRNLLEGGGWLGVLFAGPAIVGIAAGGHVAGSAQLIMFGVAPVWTVLLVSQQNEDAMRMLTPAIVSMAGLWLMVPAVWSRSGFVWFDAVAGMVVLATWAGFRLHNVLRDVSLTGAGAAGAGVAAVLAGIGWILLEPGPVDFGWRAMSGALAWGVLVDGPLVLLTVWLLREMDPVGFSSRWLLIPAVTQLGLMVAERPEVGWVGWLGLSLVVLGALSLVGARDRGDGNLSLPT